MHVDSGLDASSPMVLQNSSCVICCQIAWNTRLTLSSKSSRWQNDVASICWLLCIVSHLDCAVLMQSWWDGTEMSDTVRMVNAWWNVCTSPGWWIRMQNFQDATGSPRLPVKNIYQPSMLSSKCWKYWRGISYTPCAFEPTVPWNANGSTGLVRLQVAAFLQSPFTAKLCCQISSW